MCFSAFNQRSWRIRNWTILLETKRLKQEAVKLLIKNDEVTIYEVNIG